MWPWKKSVPKGYVCRVCGKSHADAPSALGHALPDEVWALGPEARAAHLEWSTDLAFHEGRWFLRGVLGVPLTFRDGSFDFGVWAEVEEATIQWFRQNWDRDLSAEPRHSGKLANAIATYPDTTGLALTIQFGPSDQRPSLFLAPCDHPLYPECDRGMDEERYHAILVRAGY